MRKITFVAALLGVGAAGIYTANASWLWGAPGKVSLLAHRGVAQQFSRANLDNKTCTAAQMLAPTHRYLENTLPSIKAAFAYGADIVEIDIHPTTDGEFAVFHDWTLECRTDGQGVTREQTIVYLKTLDIGHGYTADGGATYPFRGQFKGAMPTLGEVLKAFPDRRFLINIKSNDANEADLLVPYLKAASVDVSLLAFFGGDAPIERLRKTLPNAKMLSRKSAKRCAIRYLATGWFGQVPEDCRNTLFFVPINYRFLAWGWPNLLVDRMRGVNTDVFVIGPYGSGTERSGTTAVDDPADAQSFVDGYAGGISTDRIDVMDSALKPVAADQDGD
jgi:glycerophosphoryl diester phosphodiesterase